MSSIVPSLDNTLGALLIGFTLSTALYGMFLLQASNYYRQYHSDKTGYKVIVALLLLLVTANQTLIAHSVYYYTVTNFLNILVLESKPLWSLVFQLLVGAVVGTIVKFLFTLRVWRFSYGNVWVTAILLFLNFGQLGLAIAYVYKCYELAAIPDLVNLRALGIVALSVSVVNDIGIAIALCYFLQRMRLRYTQSDSLIRRLTLYAVNTGVLTSALSFTTLILYNFMPANFIFIGCYFVLSKVYAVSFVAALGTRQTAQDQSTDATSKKPLTRQSGTDQRFSLPISTPPQIHTIIQNPPYGIEEGGPSAPGSNQEFVVRASPDFSRWSTDPDPHATQSRDRPLYAVGW